MIESLVSIATIGTLVYAATNIDDLFVLAVFFADPHIRVGAIITGRFLGLSALVLASLAAALLALAIPAQWIALLGFVPLFLGIRLLPALVRHQDEHDETSRPHGAASQGFAAQALAVAGVTLANGGDNLSIYIPLFATAPEAIIGYIAVFAAMTALWCGLGYLAVNNPIIGTHIRRYGHKLLPIVLIGLGIHILVGALPLLHGLQERFARG